MYPILIGLLVGSLLVSGYRRPVGACVAYIFIAVMTGALAETYDLGLAVKEWATIGLGTGVILSALLHPRPRTLTLTWIDWLLAIYVLFVVVIPILVNPAGWGVSTGRWVQFLIPLKIWVLYKVFLSAVLRVRHQDASAVSSDRLLTAFLGSAAIAAVIAMARYLPLGPAQEWIEQTWPIISNGEHLRIAYWGRLWATMSGTNGSGIFFAFCALAAVNRHMFGWGQKYLWLSVFLGLAVVMSGSLSAIAGAAAAAPMIFRFTFRRVFATLALLVIGITGLMMTETFGDPIRRRISMQFGQSSGDSVLPLNVPSRLGYWQTHLRILWSENAIVAGLGPQALTDYAPGDTSIHRNPEGFYSALMIHAGLLGVLAYMLLKGQLLRRLMAVKRFIRRSAVGTWPLFDRSWSRLVPALLVMYLVTHIGNPTMYYGGSLELFSLLLASTYLLWKRAKGHQKTDDMTGAAA